MSSVPPASEKYSPPDSEVGIVMSGIVEALRLFSAFLPPPNSVQVLWGLIYHLQEPVAVRFYRTGLEKW
jgi:hypothetical protein